MWSGRSPAGGSHRRLALMCCAALALSGCQWSGATRTVSLGPQEKTVILVVEPGDPLQIMSQGVVVEMRRLADGGLGRQRIDGWVAMPPAHWREVERILAPVTPVQPEFPPPPPVLPERFAPPERPTP